MEPMKRCPSCGETKEISTGFGWRTEKGRQYARSYCRTCMQQRREGGRWIRSTVPLPPAPEGSARCGRCKAVKPAGDFARDRNRVNGLSNTCRACVSQGIRARFDGMTPAQIAEFRRRKAASASKHPATRKAASLRFAFNMTLGQYEALLTTQGGVCAICKRPETATRLALAVDLSVDHDHSCCPEKGRSCGRCVRGLLCGRCNNGLGQFMDDPELLLAAVRYLQDAKVIPAVTGDGEDDHSRV